MTKKDRKQKKRENEKRSKRRLVLQNKGLSQQLQQPQRYRVVVPPTGLMQSQANVAIAMSPPNLSQPWGDASPQTPTTTTHRYNLRSSSEARSPTPDQKGMDTSAKKKKK